MLSISLSLRTCIRLYVTELKSTCILATCHSSELAYLTVDRIAGIEILKQVLLGGNVSV